MHITPSKHQLLILKVALRKLKLTCYTNFKKHIYNHTQKTLLELQDETSIKTFQLYVTKLRNSIQIHTQVFIEIFSHQSQWARSPQFGEFGEPYTKAICFFLIHILASFQSFPRMMFIEPGQWEGWDQNVLSVAQRPETIKTTAVLVGEHQQTGN